MLSTRTRAALVGAAAAMAALTAACSSTHGTASSQPHSSITAVAVLHASASPSPSPSRSGPLDPAAQAAVTSYTRMWQTVEADAGGGSYDILALSAYVTGKPLQLFSENLATWHAKGMVVKGAAITHPSVTGESPAGAPTTVDITDHLDDRNALLYYSATGALVDQTPGGCRLIHATVTDMHGVWRVTALDTGADGPCAAS